MHGIKRMKKSIERVTCVNKEIYISSYCLEVTYEIEKKEKPFLSTHKKLKT